MQRLVVKATAGIANTLEAMSLIRHFEQECGVKAISSVLAFRDSQTKRHLNYLMFDATEEAANRLTSTREHYVRVLRPTNVTASDATYAPLRYKTTLQDVINTLKPPSAKTSASSTGDGSDIILQVTVERAATGMVTTPRPMRRRVGSLPGQIPYRRPEPVQIEDLLILFDGFANPGRLRKQVVQAPSSV